MWHAWESVVHRVWGEIEEKKKPLRPRRRWENNINMDLQVIRWEGHRLDLFSWR